MKRRKRGKPPPLLGQASMTFTRGFVATALLVALRRRAGTAAPSGRTILKHALQGATALTAGTIAAEALTRRNFSLAADATTAGAAGVLLAEALLITHHQDDKENGRGQEEA